MSGDGDVGHASVSQTFDRKCFTHSSLKPVSLIKSSSVGESRNIPTTVFKDQAHRFQATTAD